MRRIAVSHLAVIALLGTACGPSENLAEVASAGTVRDPNCTPVQRGEANAPSQEPAFEGQTRACEELTNVAFEVTVVASGLEHPWAVEPLPGGDLLVTERPGRMRIVSASGTVGERHHHLIP